MGSQRGVGAVDAARFAAQARSQFDDAIDQYHFMDMTCPGYAAQRRGDALDEFLPLLLAESPEVEFLASHGATFGLGHFCFSLPREPHITFGPPKALLRAGYDQSVTARRLSREA
jgi:hypothetical protein